MTKTTSTMALIILIVALSFMLGESSYPADANQLDHQQHPPVYVIQADQPQAHSNLPQRHWNNQKLVARPQAPALAPSSARQAKQIMYTDEPVPFYHSYKFMGHQMGEGAFVDQYYKPLRRNHYNSELPDWLHHHHHQSAVAPRVRPYPVASDTKGISGSKGRKSPANRQHHTTTSHHHAPPTIGDSFDTGLRRDPNQSQNRNATNRASGKRRKNLVCYYGTWAVYRPDAGKYPVENIDPFLCTHIIYGFTGLSYDNMIKPLDPWNDLEDNYGKGAMKRFTNLKRINPDLKTLVAIGGWNEGSIKYSKMASEPEARAKFVQSVVEFLAKYNFDGLDLDWEYPGARGGYSYDKQNFVKLLRELKEAFAPHQYLLTAAVSAGKWFVDPAYDIPQVSKYLDLINLMAYDYHGGWETKTGMNAPLFHSPKHDSRDEALLNVNWSVNYWLQQGASAEKIMLGVGSYGRSFTLDKVGANGINAPASQKGQAGPYTREPGSLGYNEICEAFMRQPQAWTIVRDPDYLAPYAYNQERQWVGYDDMESLALKAQFAKSMGLGGMMMWSIETDDFQGRCHNEKYPLLNTIRRVMDGGENPVIPTSSSLSPSTTRRPARPAQSTTTRPALVTPTSTTPGHEVEEDEQPASVSSTTSTTTKRPTTARAVPGTSRRPRPPSGGGSGSSSTSRRPARPSPASVSTSTSTTSTTTSRPRPNGDSSGGEFVCRADGMFADPRDCRKFIRCVSSGQNYSLFRFDCGPGTAFNEQQQYCDFIYNVPNCSASSASSQRRSFQQQLNLSWPAQVSSSWLPNEQTAEALGSQQHEQALDWTGQEHLEANFA